MCVKETLYIAMYVATLNVFCIDYTDLINCAFTVSSQFPVLIFFNCQVSCGFGA